MSPIRQKHSFTCQVASRLTREDFWAIDAIAKTQQASRAVVVRLAVRQYLEKCSDAKAVGKDIGVLADGFICHVKDK